MKIMAKKKVFRVVGIVRSKDLHLVLGIMSDFYLPDVCTRYCAGYLKSDKKKCTKRPKQTPLRQRVQLNFTDKEKAEECREQLASWFIEDKSDF